MQTDALAKVSWRAQPRSFIALMALYESNYVRLGWLAPDIGALRGTHRSSVAHDCDLLLIVREHSRYTNTLDLTYRLTCDDGIDVTSPDMRLRIYRDARMVEAQQWCVKPSHSALRALRGCCERELDHRWARNIMLNKWLEYCVERGHGFSPATRTDRPT